MKRKILIIEDITEIRESTAELLELAGYDVVTAVDGTSGLALLKNVLPDLIICDIRMSGMDGYDVLAALKSDPYSIDIPFLFCTAQSEKKDVDKAKDAGIHAYLIKPFTETELLSMVERCISESNRPKHG